jgi:hypothetical protein
MQNLQTKRKHNATMGDPERQMDTEDDRLNRELEELLYGYCPPSPQEAESGRMNTPPTVRRVLQAALQKIPTPILTEAIAPQLIIPQPSEETVTRLPAG